MHRHAQSAETLAVCALGQILKGPFDRNWALDKMAVLFAYRQLNQQQTEFQTFRGSEMERIWTKCVFSAGQSKHLQAAALSKTFS